MKTKSTALKIPMLLTLLGLAVAVQAVVPHFSSAKPIASDSIAQTMNDSKKTRHPIYYSENGVALDGQDVVAYFTQSDVVNGQKQYSHKWGGTTWLFSSAKNRDLFVKNPAKYAPQYGGYCAKAAAGGVLATTVPTAWTVLNDKLYLNYSAGAQQEWKQDTATKIAQANKNWPMILNNESLKK